LADLADLAETGISPPEIPTKTGGSSVTPRLFLADLAEITYIEHDGDLRHKY
jgi:hypothetical protein